jgi:hypothetical protein
VSPKSDTPIRTRISDGDHRSWLPAKVLLLHRPPEQQRNGTDSTDDGGIEESGLLMGGPSHISNWLRPEFGPCAGHCDAVNGTLAPDKAMVEQLHSRSNQLNRHVQFELRINPPQRRVKDIENWSEQHR